MTEEAALAPPKPRSGRRVLWIFLAAFAALLLILLGVFLYFWIPTGKVIERERGRVREGIASLRAERVTRPALFEPAEDGNGWDPFSKVLTAFGQLDEAELGAFPSLNKDEERTVPDAEVIARAVANVEIHVDTLRSALRRTWVEPGYPYEEGFSMKLPLVALSIKATRILGDRARSLHDEGRTADAVDRLVLGWGVADRIAVKGCLVQELVRIACNAIASDQLKAILADHQLSAADLARLESTLAVLDGSRPDMLACYRREHVLGASSIIDVLDGKGGVELVPERENSWWMRIPARFMAAGYFDRKPELDRNVEQAVALDLPQRLRRLDELTNEVTKERKSFFMVLLTPALMRCWKNDASDVRGFALTRLAVALARHREDLGAFPRGLDGLAPRYLPAIPRDPFTGRPFEYAVAGGAAKVWAWGEDGDNDGGVPSPDESDEDGDIVWTVKRKAR